MERLADRLGSSVRAVLAGIGRLIDPLLPYLAQTDADARARLDDWGVPARWHAAAVLAAWAVPLLIALRLLPVWPRLGVLLIAALVLARVHGLLPGSAYR